MTGNVVKLFHGRQQRGKKLPKPVLCKECEEPLEAARLQACANDILRCVHCISCAHLFEKRFERQMQGVRAHQAVKVIR